MGVCFFLLTKPGELTPGDCRVSFELGGGFICFKRMACSLKSCAQMRSCCTGLWFGALDRPVGTTVESILCTITQQQGHEGKGNQPPTGPFSDLKPLRSSDTWTPLTPESVTGRENLPTALNPACLDNNNNSKNHKPRMFSTVMK